MNEMLDSENVGNRRQLFEFTLTDMLSKSSSEMPRRVSEQLPNEYKVKAAVDTFRLKNFIMSSVML